MIPYKEPPFENPPACHRRRPSTGCMQPPENPENTERKQVAAKPTSPYDGLRFEDASAPKGPFLAPPSMEFEVTLDRLGRIDI